MMELLEFNLPLRRRKYLVASVIVYCLSVSMIKADSQNGYLVSAPAIFRSGVNQSITVRIFQHKNPVLVNATVRDWLEQTIVTSTITTVQENGIITLLVPKGIRGKATLEICGNCHLHSGFQFQNSTTITIVDKGISAFIQTDKPIYKPSQIVQIIIYTIDRDLRPVFENATVYVKTPNNIKIMEWKNLRPSSCCGAINISFPLSDQPLLGTWEIVAKLQGNHFQDTFEVKKYVLPKFGVTITPPPTFRDFAICEQAIVRAKYHFGQPVKGNLLVNTTVTGIGYSRNHIDRADTTLKNMSFNGEARFSICLQDNLGRKHLSRHFRGRLSIQATVTSEDGSKFTAFDESTVVSRYFVEVEFTRQTRKHFKPDIPFSGQLQVKFLNGSAAENVLVQLKAEDQRGIVITQELLSHSDGLISFSIPAPPESTKFMWLDARVVAINAANTGHQYLSIYHIIHSWHSPSKCNILAEGSGEDLEVGKPTKIQIKSTCPCNFTLYYEWLSRGDIVNSGSMTLNETSGTTNKRALRVNKFDEVDELSRHFCSFFIPLTPTPNMAPWLKLLAYYVRTDGEGVADSIQFPVKLNLENKVSITASKSSASPGEFINVSVQAAAKSCVCLGIVDKSFHVMRPNYALSKKDIEDELLSYDMDNLPFDDVGDQYSSSSRRRKRSSHGHQHIWRNRDSFHAFLESGLVVMTNFVRLDHKQNTQFFSELRRQPLQQFSTATPSIRKQRRVRSFFPESWVWKCFQLSDSTNQVNLTLKVPDSITSWLANAVAVNREVGIGLSDSYDIEIQKSFFLDFKLPYSAIRGEQMRLPLTVHNYLHICTEVRVAVVIPQGVTFNKGKGRKFIQYFCVDAQSTRVISVDLTFEKLGSLRIAAVADAAEGSRKCCIGNKMTTDFIATNYSTVPNDAFETNIVGKDAVVRRILVEAEGEPREYTHSIFFCPNDRINITSRPSTFHFLKLAQNRQTFNFWAKAQSSVHIALAETEMISEDTYEIVLGGQGNTRSWIQRNQSISNVLSTDGILSDEEFRSFWIKWSESNITVGYGMDATVNSEIMSVSLTNSKNVVFIGLATTGNTAATFHLWSKDDLSDGFSEVFQLDVPKNAVLGSVKGIATVIGDVLGPTLENLNNLLQLPHGCGEQNMINFAPNIYILDYLKGTNQLTSKIEKQATEYLIQGYQRQLTYKRMNGSYSAFGDRDELGSMWLTAFVMKSYSQAKKFIYIDENEISQSLSWILSHQSQDGSFPVLGRILNKDAQGGINKKISLTAYVAIALSETTVHHMNLKKSLKRAIAYLENVRYEYQDPYTAALTAHALTLSGSSFAHEARVILLDMSVTTNSGTYRYWPLQKHVEAFTSDATDMFLSFDNLSKQTVASAEVELASYALLAFTRSKDISTSLSIVRWITQQRNSQGGFSSTQDTCMALQALSYYATIAYIGGVKLNITLEGPESYVLNFTLNTENSEVLQTGDIPPLGPEPVPLFVKANGEGCALLQINIRYNIPNPSGKKDFDLSASIAPLNLDERAHRAKLEGQEDQPMRTISNEFQKQTFSAKVCMRWLHPGSSNMAVLEYSLLTGFSVDEESLERALSAQSKILKRYEIEKSRIIFYFDEISNLCETCVEFQVVEQVEIANIQEQRVKIYDYYEPGFDSTIFYQRVQEGEQGVNTVSSEDFDESFPECKCYKECGYEGPEVCGSDGNMYGNRCRLQMTSCESEKDISQEDHSFCKTSEHFGESTFTSPLVPVDPDYEHEYGNYDGVFEVYPADEAVYRGKYNSYQPNY